MGKKPRAAVKISPGLAPAQRWYDPNGNRVDQTGQAASIFTIAAGSNRLQSTFGSLARTYEYDDAGNVRVPTVPLSLWDVAQRLASTKHEIDGFQDK